MGLWVFILPFVIAFTIFIIAEVWIYYGEKKKKKIEAEEEYERELKEKEKEEEKKKEKEEKKIKLFEKILALSQDEMSKIDEKYDKLYGKGSLDEAIKFVDYNSWDKTRGIWIHDLFDSSLNIFYFIYVFGKKYFIRINWNLCSLEINDFQKEYPSKKDLAKYLLDGCIFPITSCSIRKTSSTYKDALQYRSSDNHQPSSLSLGLTESMFGTAAAMKRLNNSQSTSSYRSYDSTTYKYYFNYSKDTSLGTDEVTVMFYGQPDSRDQEKMDSLDLLCQFFSPQNLLQRQKIVEGNKEESKPKIVEQTDTITKLKDLQNLLNEKVITQEEFNKLKSEILSKNSNK